MPLDLTHEGLSTANNIRLYLSLAEISLGIATQTLNYNDVRRIITPSNGESVASSFMIIHSEQSEEKRKYRKRFPASGISS